MTWREMLFAYTAKVARDCGLEDLARALETAKVPVLDGGGMRFLISCNGEATVARGEYQRVPASIAVADDAEGVHHVAAVVTIGWFPVEFEREETISVDRRLRIKEDQHTPHRGEKGD